MRVRFWGTRGSLPVALTAADVRAKLVAALLRASGRSFAGADEAEGFLDEELRFAERATYGGATSCVEIETAAPSYFVCDLGSGVRHFALDSLRRNAGGHAKTYNVFLSHLHWDHIMGFPFFVPAFAKDVTIRIFAGHADAETAIRRQQEEISFPVPFDWLAAKIEFVTMSPGTPIDVDGVRVDIIEQKHSHMSYGYRFTDRDGRSAVYSTDSEHKPTDMADEEAFIAFIRDADLVICDTMYSLADSVSMKEDWGHSSNVVAIDLCQDARVKRLALFHHEPTYDDQAIQRMHDESIRYEELTREGPPLEVICAYDGLELAF